MKNNKISIKRTYYRTIAILVMFVVFTLSYRWKLTPNADISIFAIFSHERSSELLSIVVLVDILFFLLTFIGLHLIWAFIITASCNSFFQKYKNDDLRTQFWLVIVLLHILFILAANSYYAPTSLLAIFRDSVLSNLFVVTSLGGLISYFFFKALLQTRRWKLAIFSLLTAGILFTPPLFKTQDFQFKEPEKPNIIIIGLDGLRPDHLKYRNAQNNLTPNLNAYLEKSIIYDRSYTTLPRTFVAWLSLLKSQYPMVHGGRFNLSPDEVIDKSIPLIADLKTRGYKSTYALDERRFNHIDQSYGFDEIVGPKIGIADQLITSVADFPILNLLSNTRFGYYFLPYINLNRANGKTFSPNAFNLAALEQLAPNQPNFLAIHFCMLHFPYTSKDFINVKPELWQGNYQHFMYQSLLEKLDLQLDHLIGNLKEKGYLNNAIVYIISDHGDSFTLEKDKLKAGFEVVDKKLQPKVESFGHGTNVLDQTQANILLSYSRYENGKQINQAEIMNGLFSLLDIVPTIYNDLAIPPPHIQGEPLPMKHSDINLEKFVFVDSSVPVKSIDTSMINKKKVFSETANNYIVNEEGRPVLTPDAHYDFIPKQHRSVYYKDWQLALLPDYQEMILVNIKSKEWHELSKYQGNAPHQKMLATFCEHYSKDKLFDSSKICAL